MECCWELETPSNTCCCRMPLEQLMGVYHDVIKELTAELVKPNNGNLTNMVSIAKLIRCKGLISSPVPQGMLKYMTFITKCERACFTSILIITSPPLFSS